eukprot:CAMPEP_0179151264 /NCGR_PEP_ID=MMETSP0796-20121207/73425_1 /TAXON_ID=73915 /ORGANISM="Pyrodinium bahamense, Strain pbaha01" /LENGTH=158 /DNA_ID=CAMNT_0020852339 /DNA_START=20 /DNA_END=493 /DNA_ORIENTATION=-
MTSPGLAPRCKGIPKLTALCRIWVAGDMAGCPRPPGEGCASGDCSCTGSSACAGSIGLAGPSFAHWPGKKGLMEKGDAPVLAPPDGCAIAGVTGDHGGLHASVEHAHGDMAMGEATGEDASPAPPGAAGAPRGSSRVSAPAIWMSLAVAGIFRRSARA